MELEAGEVIIQGREGQYTGRVIVEGTIETVWQVLTDYENFDRFLPNVAASELIEVDGNRSVFEQVNRVRILFFSRESRVRVAATGNYPRRIDFELVEGDLRALNGTWQVEEIPLQSNQFLITHRVNVVPEPSSNPGLFYNVYEDTLEDTLAAIQQEIEQRKGESENPR